MSVKTNISDSTTGMMAAVVDGHDETHALAVATRPLKTFDNTVRFFTSDEFGIDMNQDASTGGTPEMVHNGTDSILWTASDIVGGRKTTFNSADQNHTTGGDLSVKINNSPVDDVFQFAKGSDVDLNGYASLTMWLYVDKDWKIGDSIEVYGWDTDTNSQVGISAKLEDYFAYGEFDTWHKLTIPLANMELSSTTTLDAFRFRIVTKERKSPKWYLDDFQIEETGTPIKYSLKPAKGTWLHIDVLSIIIVANIPSTITDGTMPAISYDSLLGVDLPSGITYKREQDNETILTLQIKSMIDLLQLPNAIITSTGSDGVNTFIKIDQKLTAPFILKPENSDILSYTVNDNLSDLLALRISAGARIETREAE